MPLNRNLGLRIACWTVALTLGAAQAWATRFTMNPDGISYLDIGDAYWRHDWQHAINAYWSPLYSWILGFFINVIKPNAYWEYPLVHLVNFLIYVFALGCFELFLSELLLRRDSAIGAFGLSQAQLRMLGYGLFTSCSLVLIGLNLVSPDLCLSALIYVASALAVKIQTTISSSKSITALGVVLGLSYLTKAVMFPLAFVFLIFANPWNRGYWYCLRRLLLGLLAFSFVATPFVAMISRQKRSITFGDSGKINYEIEVQRGNWFVPTAPVVHPQSPMPGVASGRIFESHKAGTYSLWYDPSYWHEGAQPAFSVAKQLGAFFRGARAYWRIFSGPFWQLPFSLLAAILVLLSPTKIFFSRLARSSFLWVPAMAALGLYSLVVVETRYAAPFLVIVFLAIFFAVTAGKNVTVQEVQTACTVLLLFLVVVQVLVWTVALGRLNTRMYAEAATELLNRGLRPGDQLVVVGQTPEGEGGAFVARLARLAIVGEVRSPEAYLKANPTEQRRAAKNTGVKTVLIYAPGARNVAGERLDNTNYYVLSFGHEQ